MEITGIKIDREYLENMKAELEEKMKAMETSIYEEAGVNLILCLPSN